MKASFFPHQDLGSLAGNALGMGLLGGFLPRTIAGMLSPAQGNMLRIALDAFYVALRQNKIAMRERMQPEVYINIDMQGNHTFSFSNAQDIMRLGYQQTRRRLQRLT